SRRTELQMPVPDPEGSLMITRRYLAGPERRIISARVRAHWWTIGLAILLMSAVVYPLARATAAQKIAGEMHPRLMLPTRCADIGGVFAAHGTDGRGDCVSADPRPICHVSPAQQTDENYVGEVALTPPFPNGVPEMTELMYASNKDCWKLAQ
ncbi:MAG: hypothetical protein J2P19_20290, partial [Pseudonocardia sp.]|nr:hypothetical protein [Pseudonocardia sp.]